MSAIKNASAGMDRRGFLQSAAGGLLLGFHLTRGAKPAAAADRFQAERVDPRRLRR